MKIDYKGKNWDKEAKEYKNVAKSINYCFNKSEAYLIREYEDEGKNNPFRLYSCLSKAYAGISNGVFMHDYESNEAVKYTYLSGCAGLVSKRLWEKGYREKYISDSDVTDVDYSLFRLIASGGVFHDYIGKDVGNLIMLMYNQRFEEAVSILKDIEFNETGKGCEWYYYDPSYLKPIYMAIINHDGEAFNRGLVRRIMKYRTNMVGYSVIVDVVSVALIKMAKKAGINCNVDVIEIPKQFFSDKQNGLEAIKLPFYDELIEKGILP